MGFHVLTTNTSPLDPVVYKAFNLPHFLVLPPFRNGAEKLQALKRRCLICQLFFHVKTFDLAAAIAK